jgi:hypothetical protein
MLLRLAQILEQLDLAHEHLQQGDPNNARFGLMLTDNALEISLHRLALHEDQRAQQRRWQPDYVHPHARALAAAMGQDFGAKVRLAERLGMVSAEEAGSIRVGHAFRNETYHVGVQHEDVLQDVALFYFHVACAVLARITPGFFGWSSSDRLPERAAKYFTNDGFMPGRMGDYERACARLAAGCGHDPAELVAVLARHMAEVVEEQDAALDFLANDAPNPSTRREAVVELQAWALAFGEAGRTFLNRLPNPPKSVFAQVAAIGDGYPGLVRSDPIPSWRRRAAGLARETNPHRALQLYRAFMDQTLDLRRAIDESARALDAHIQNEVDRMRGK